MAKLPISRVVNISLTRQDNLPNQRGFGIPMIICPKDEWPNGVTELTRPYGSMEEVAADFASTSEAYKAANMMFSQERRPIQIKIGQRDTAQDIQGELDKIWDEDQGWYWGTFTRELTADPNDTDDAVAASEWFQSKKLIALFNSRDSKTEDKTDTTNLAYLLKTAEHERSSVFYHDSIDYFTGAVAAYCATRDFDAIIDVVQPSVTGAAVELFNNLEPEDPAYTLKFKNLNNVPVLNKPSSVIQAVTGFIPDLGLTESTGHLANVYVDMGGVEMVLESPTANGTFIDEIHAGDWLVARMEEELLTVLATTARVPMTNKGIQLLINAVQKVMERASGAGIIADLSLPGEDVIPAYTIGYTRVENIPVTQRRQRIAPSISVCFRYAGAVHYANVNISMKF